MKVTADWSAVSEVRAKLEGVGPKATRLAKAAIRESAHDIEAGAKRIVPVKTGNLKNSIGVTTAADGLSAVIGPTANYGVHVEFGTVKRKPRPYMGPALEKVKPGFEQAIQKIAEGLLE